MMTFIENDILNINCLRQYDIKIWIFLLPCMYLQSGGGGGLLYTLPIPRPPLAKKLLLKADFRKKLYQFSSYSTIIFMYN